PRHPSTALTAHPWSVGDLSTRRVTTVDHQIPSDLHMVVPVHNPHPLLPLKKEFTRPMTTRSLPHARKDGAQ
ncbi:MAG TPA: hypothetical protein VMB82_09920, partial [Acidimicrobiales bacterium]|nr:hypothetical protein [Acidimicrobiales bacterium]